MKNKIDKSKPRDWLPENVIVHSSTDLSAPKTKKQKFIDILYGEFETSLKYLQIAAQSTHPDRKNENRTKTMLSKYGVVNNSQLPEYKEKFRSTMLSRYGVENALKSPELRDKVKKTNVSRYGADWKHVQTEKARAGLLKKYGVNNPGKINARPVFSGKNAHEISKEKDVPVCLIYRYLKEHGIEATEDWIENHKSYKSILETQFQKTIENLPSFNKKICDDLKYKPDFKLSEDTYIDVDGLIYHSDLYKKDNKYHINKRIDYENVGLRLLQFRQDEIKERPLIIQSMIGNIKKSNTRIFARKCSLQEIEFKEASEFLERTHLMGKGPASRALGLFYDNKLVSVMTFKETKTGSEIVRYSNELNTSIIGGFSKLCKFLEAFGGEIVSFVDLRYATGESLEKNAFKRSGTTLGWKWTDGVKTFNRLYCKANMDARGLSEKEYAKELGLYKIYDAGQAKYVKTL